MGQLKQTRARAPAAVTAAGGTGYPAVSVSSRVGVGSLLADGGSVIRTYSLLLNGQIFALDQKKLEKTTSSAFFLKTVPEFQDTSALTLVWEVGERTVSPVSHFSAAYSLP